MLFWNLYKYLSRSRYILNRYREIYMTQQEAEKSYGGCKRTEC